MEVELPAAHHLTLRKDGAEAIDLAQTEIRPKAAMFSHTLACSSQLKRPDDDDPWRDERG